MVQISTTELRSELPFLPPQTSFVSQFWWRQYILLTNKQTFPQKKLLQLTQMLLFLCYWLTEGMHISTCILNALDLCKTKSWQFWQHWLKWRKDLTPCSDSGLLLGRGNGLGTSETIISLFCSIRAAVAQQSLPTCLQPWQSQWWRTGRSDSGIFWGSPCEGLCRYCLWTGCISLGINSIKIFYEGQASMRPLLFS